MITVVLDREISTLFSLALCTIDRFKMILRLLYLLPAANLSSWWIIAISPKHMAYRLLMI